MAKSTTPLPTPSARRFKVGDLVRIAMPRAPVMKIEEPDFDQFRPDQELYRCLWTIQGAIRRDVFAADMLELVPVTDPALAV